MGTQTIAVAILGVLVVLASTGDAHAYLDPGTGSMLLQGLIGGIAAGLLVLKLWWSKVKALFARGDARHGGTDTGVGSAKKTTKIR